MLKVYSLNKVNEEVDDSIVRIDYGPYEAHGVITHRIQRLRGLIRHLTDLGYELEIRQVNLLNRLEIIMYRRKIFQCDIRNLQFNMMSEYDPVCLRIVEAVEEAAKRMRLDQEDEEEIRQETMHDESEVKGDEEHFSGTEQYTGSKTDLMFNEYEFNQ